jgi:peptidoglycan hydrolase-like protein with peptidoglycan-binding domain
LAVSKIAVEVLRMPTEETYLAGAPPPPQPPKPEPAATTPSVAPLAPTSPPPTPPPPPATATASIAMPDEGLMTDAERRLAQGALAKLGYYDLSVDGIIGPETRAGIRRYQHEIGAEMTGRLTAAQASKLVSGR